MSEEKKEIVPLDVIMWVGRRYYTIESFIEEAKRVGACKRIQGLPRDIKVGKSRVFLIHDTGEEEKKAKERGQARVFAYYTIQGIMVVGAKEKMEAEGIKPIDYDRAVTMSERGCGKLVSGGMYLVSEEDMEKIQKYADMAKGQITVIDPPILTALKRFRGYKYVLGNNILEAHPEDWWFKGVEEIRQRNEEIRHPKAGKRTRYDSTPAERLEYIKKRAKELHLSRMQKHKKIKAEVIEKFGLKESTAGWQVWNYVFRRREKK